MVDLNRQIERDRMVDQQIIPRGIRDQAVLAALRSVPRHRFVPSNHQDEAYNDHPIAIGHGQTISQPYIVAFMTEALQLRNNEKVLEIGTGSGYQAAILAEIGCRVFTIEIVETLAVCTAKTLVELGYSHVNTKAGNGYQGWPDEAPFDAIILTAAPDHIPAALVHQLAHSGRMILPLGKLSQQLVEIRLTEKGVRQYVLLPVSFVPMTGEP